MENEGNAGAILISIIIITIWFYLSYSLNKKKRKEEICINAELIEIEESYFEDDEVDNDYIRNLSLSEIWGKLENIKKSEFHDYCYKISNAFEEIKKDKKIENELHINISKLNKKIGIENAICPYCKTELKKLPQAKTKCKECGNDIYSRTRVYDNKKILLKEDELDLFEFEKIKKDCGDFVIKESDFNKAKEYLLNIRKNGFVPNNDIIYRVLTIRDEQAAFHLDIDDCWRVKNEIGRFFLAEGSIFSALDNWLEEGYISIISNMQFGEPRCYLDRNFVKALDMSDLSINDLKKSFIGKKREFITQTNIFDNFLPREEAWICLLNSIKILNKWPPSRGKTPKWRNDIKI